MNNRTSTLEVSIKYHFTNRLLNTQKYLFVILTLLLSATRVGAQCLSLPNMMLDQIAVADRIFEGQVLAQNSWLGSDGNVYTTNRVEVHRVFKGQVSSTVDVTTEGGVFGNMLQIVTPSAKMKIGDYGLIELMDDPGRSISSLVIGFFPVDSKSGTVYRMKNISDRDQLYDLMQRTVGNDGIDVGNGAFDTPQVVERSVPVIANMYPLTITAGTQSLLTITGEGFGAEQGNGFVAFKNANDGGQSQVALSAGPHYVSWTDTEIRMYVPSTSLYSTTVAGTGEIRVVNAAGGVGISPQQLNVGYAKSEVVYSQSLNETQMVSIDNGGYVFHKNSALQSLMGGHPMVRNALEKWSCNTGVNFKLSDEILEQSSFENNGINLLGLSFPGQLPNYLLGKTVTTFSGCGTGSGIQWNLIEIDILMNGDIDWWTSDAHPMANRYDLNTALLHELGHAHLLQHNMNTNSPMYFQLTPGSMRRNLHPEADIAGGSHITTLANDADWTCSYTNHEGYDFSSCNLSIVNSVDDQEEDRMLAYPNPFRDFIQLSGVWNAATNYFMFDATGRMVSNGHLQDDNRIQTEALPTGFYLLQLSDSDRTETLRLLKN